jgi:hypothetical protein
MFAHVRTHGEDEVFFSFTTERPDFAATRTVSSTIDCMTFVKQCKPAADRYLARIAFFRHLSTLIPDNANCCSLFHTVLIPYGSISIQ